MERRSLVHKETQSQLDSLVAALKGDRLTRREFLRRGTTLGLTASLLADSAARCCPAAAAEAPTPEVVKNIAKEGKRLFIYNWEDYIHPRIIPAFEREFGVKVTYDTFPSNEHLLAKLQAGGARYDVVFPTHNFLQIYLAQGLLAPLNHDHMPLLSNLLPRFRNNPVDPGNTYGVPYSWGTTALAHNTKYTTDDPHLGNWALLFESGPQRYSGKLGMTDEREEVIAAALQYLGYNPNSRDTSQLRQAGEVLQRLKPHIKAFYPGAEVRKALITEDIVVSHSWSGETVKAQESNATVAWSFPKEGATGWFDVMAIPKVAPHKFTAEVFINYMLRPEVAADNAATTGYAVANQAAIARYVAPKLAQNPAIYPPDELLARVTFLEVIPDEILPVYEDIWLRVLAG
jgi:spermidine/putrescine transport system substrate-binding protein